MGIICAENIAGKEPRALDYRMIPRAVYSSPQVASFGYTEAQAKEAGFAVKVGKFNFQANGKALGLGEYQGWVKVITDEKYGEILSRMIEESEEIVEKDKEKIIRASTTYSITKGTIDNFTKLGSVAELFEMTKPVVSIKNAGVIKG